MAVVLYAEMVKDIYYEYYNRNLTLPEYRAQRKIIFDKMDLVFNGASPAQDDSVNDDDVTIPNNQ